MDPKKWSYEKWAVIVCVVLVIGLIGYQIRQDYLRDPGFMMPSFLRWGK